MAAMLVFLPVTPTARAAQPGNTPGATADSAKISVQSKGLADETGDYSARFQKTRLCRFFPACKRGASCPFAHGTQEVRSCPNLTKTKLCTSWSKGHCPNPASACRFAHGTAELRASQGTHDASEGVTPPPSHGMDSWDTKRSLEDLRDQEASPEVAKRPFATELQSTPGARSAQGEQRLGSAVSMDVMMLDGLVPILSSWLIKIKKMASDTMVKPADTGHGECDWGSAREALPTPEECRVALLMCMPNHYED